MPVSLLPVIAEALDTTLDALVNDEAHTTAAAPKKHGPQKKIQQQMKLIETLPIAKQRVIAQWIDSMLQSNPNKKPAQCAGFLFIRLSEINLTSFF